MTLSIRGRVFLGSILACSVGISIICAVFLMETFFFDRFIFKKNPTFGYLHDQKINQHARLADFDQLIQAPRSDSVLGSSDAADEFVIGIFGDSWSHGLGIKEPARFPTILEKELQTISPTQKIKVLNFSYPGDNLFDHYYKWTLAQKKGIPLDLIIVQTLDNDFLINRQAPYSHYTFSDHPLAQQLLSENCQGLMPIFTLQSEQEYASLGTEVASTVDAVHRQSYDPQNANVCFFSALLSHFPPETIFFYPSLEYWYPESHIIPDTIKEHQFRFLSLHGQQDSIHLNQKDALHQLLQPQKKTFEVSRMEHHPNASYHAFMATELRQFITDTNEWRAFSSE
jgi:hypothetical protein